MTTLSLGSAFEGMGDAANGYHSATFEKFVRSLDGYRDRVEAQYVGQQYPAAPAEVSLILPRVLLTSIVAT